MSYLQTYTEQHQAYIGKLEYTLAGYSDIALAKKRLTYLRWKVVESLDKYLFEFETNVKKTDSTVHWANDAREVIDLLNQQLKLHNKVSFIPGRLLSEISLDAGAKFDSAEAAEVDVVVTASKFIVANTGNVFIALDSESQYHQVLNCKKLVVLASIDQLLASQVELGLAKMLYATFETGALRYPFEILTRPGRPRGLNCEVSIIITDNGRSKVLEYPQHRRLFYLMNFALPPICPLERVSEPANMEQHVNSLDYFIFPFRRESQSLFRHFFMNNGLRHMDRYLPYDIDMLNQVTEARRMITDQQKKNVIGKVFSQDKKALLLNKDKFNRYSRFKPVIEELMLGKTFKMQPKTERTFIQQWFYDKRKI